MATPAQRPVLAETLPPPASGVLASPHAMARRTRDLSLAFVSGAGGAWQAEDLAEWARTLAHAGFVSHQGGAVVVSEEGGGRIVVPLGADHAVDQLHRVFSLKLAKLARARVVHALTEALDRDNRFVTAALYAKRVARARLADTLTWRPTLTDRDSVSQWVLAMLAVDALTNPDDYEHLLCVCEHCGDASFAAEPHARRRCSRHR